MAGLLDLINAKELKRQDAKALAKKVNQYFDPKINFTKSGKQDIANTPLNIDTETLNLILGLKLPLSETINMITSFERNKVRNQIGLSDQEVFVGEGGNRKRMIGAEYNPKGQGLSGLLMRNIDSGDTEGRIEYNTTVDFNKMLSNFMRRR